MLCVYSGTMKNTLVFGEIFSWPTLKASRLLARKTLLMVAIYAMLSVGAYSALQAMLFGGLPRCTGNDAMVSFAIYDARGMVTGNEYACAKLRSSCTLLRTTSKGPLYECPGLMRPRS
jgi:hypothetical protein